jgi:hypothetical protein
MNYLDRGVGLQKIIIKGSAEEKQSYHSISYLKATGKLVSREVSSDQRELTSQVRKIPP